MAAEYTNTPYQHRLEHGTIRLLELLPSEACPDCREIHTCDHENNTRGENDDTDDSSSSDESSGCDGCYRCDRIRMNLTTFPVKSVAGKYDTLSYVWGDPNSVEEVECNGVLISVTSNLADALRRVRNVEGSNLLWADAICINQQDIEEKSHQVAAMREIYQFSKQTLVWLGDEDEDTEDALDLLRQGYRCAKDEAAPAPPEDYIFTHEYMTWERNKELGFPGQGDPKWDSLEKFINRPWFSRVWVVQEVSSAKESIVMIGRAGLAISWDEVSVATNWMISKANSDLIDGLDRLPHLSFICHCHSNFRSNEFMPLVTKLLPTATFQSTLEHDKIYALLGLTWEGRALQNHPRLRIDYSKDWRELYRDVVRHCIEVQFPVEQRAFELGVLNQVYHSEYKKDPFRWDPLQSSWVPKWNGSDSYCPLGWRGSTWALFAPSGSIKPKLVDSRDSRILSLKGLLIDRVSVTSKALTSLTEWYPPFSVELFRAVAKLWKLVLRNRKTRKRYPDIGDAFARNITSMSTSNPSGQDRSTYTGLDFGAFWEANLWFAEDRDTVSRVDLWEWKSLVPRTAHSSVKQLIADVDVCVELATKFGKDIEQHKVFFITEKGYIGMGPEITKPGDEVCILFGGITAFMVQPVRRDGSCPDWIDLEDEPASPTTGQKLSAYMRNLLKLEGSPPAENLSSPEKTEFNPAESPLPRKDFFRLVGECYVEGLMKGEAVDQYEAGELEEKTFHLI